MSQRVNLFEIQVNCLGRCQARGIMKILIQRVGEAPATVESQGLRFGVFLSYCVSVSQILMERPQFVYFSLAIIGKIQ